MGFDAAKISLAEERYFETLNGLWTGKKPPFATAGVIRNTNFTNSGRVDYSDVAYLQVEQKQLDKRQLNPGDIIVERSGGGPKQPVGRVVYFDRSDGPFSFSNFTSAIRVREAESFDSKFVFYNLLELYQSGQTEDIQRRTTGIRNLDFTAYKERATIPQIPLAEQRKIAGVLGVVQRAIEQQEQLLQRTTELKKTLLHQLFTHGLRSEPQKQTEIGLVPESWEVVRLGDVISDDPKNGLYKHNSAYGAGTPILRINDFGNDGDIVTSASNRVTIDDSEKKLYALSKDDIVTNRVNSLSHLGKTALIGEIPEPMVFESNMMRFRLNESRALPHYILRLLNSPVCKTQIIGSAKRAVAQSSINQGNLKAILLPLPPAAVQEEISAVLETFVNKIRLHGMRKQVLTNLFRTLLNQLMTAQIRVNKLDLSGVN